MKIKKGDIVIVDNPYIGNRKIAALGVVSVVGNYYNGEEAYAELNENNHPISDYEWVPLANLIVVGNIREKVAGKESEE
jgi:hypothetical protein